MKKRSIEILRLVQQMQIESGKKKLMKKQVAERLGISREGLKRYADDVYPYIEGKHPVEPVLKAYDTDNESPFDLLFNINEKTAAELKDLRENFDKKLNEKRNRLITSLMKNDVLAHLSSNLRKEKEQILLHNQELKEQITQLELELATAKNGLDIKAAKNEKKKNNQILVKTDLRPIFLNYESNNDIDIYDDEKDTAIEMLVKNVKRQINNNQLPIVLFIDRYLCRFDTFVEKYLANFGDAIVVQVPLFDRHTIREFVDEIGCTNPIHYYLPVCEDKAISSIQRRFFSSSVPDIELQAAEDAYIPSIRDGFKTTVSFTIEQGD